MKTQWEMKREGLMKNIERTVHEDVSDVIFSGDYIPTIENFPASHWKRKNKLEHHVGTIFIKNKKYKYILTKKEDGSFCWKQIKQQENVDVFIEEMNRKKRRRIKKWKT
ncbi:MAG: hypothetical protein IJ274_00080 [Lachnospiraceae bacterium]|nr:hypothetical protein [Lachnospiraceae bacterium]